MPHVTPFALLRVLVAPALVLTIAGCGEGEPRSAAEAGRLVVHKSLSGGPLFIEGSVTRLKVVGEDGSVVVDGLREAGTLDTPIFDRELPAGTYEVSAVERPCQGSCGLLDPPAEGTRCTVTVDVRGDRTADVEIILSGLAGGVASECSNRTPDEQSAQQPQQDARLATALSPAAVTRRCRDVAGIKTVVVRCPTRLPGGGRESRLGNLVVEGSGDWGNGRCEWLTGYRYPRQGGRDPGPVFHLVMGGRCEPLPLTTRDGRWPADVKGLEPSLRLVGYGSLSVGDPPGTPFPRVRPRVLARTSVGTEPALVLAFGPYPGSGTVHGGHQAIVFNRQGEGQTVSLHLTRGTRAQRVALLVEVAESMAEVG